MAISLAMLALVGISSFILFMIHAANKNKEVSLADHLAVEAMEAVRSFRNDRVWASDGIGALSTSTDYYPRLIIGTASSSWQLFGGRQNIDGYTRWVVFEPVSRATSTGNIHEIYDPIYDDPKTREVNVYISRNSGTSTIVSYITSWLE